MSRDVIIESSISSYLPEDSGELVGAPPGELRSFLHLPTQFGFSVTIWNADRPDVVRTYTWNTEEQRRSSPRREVGTIQERPATQWERLRGQLLEILDKETP